MSAPIEGRGLFVEGLGVSNNLVALMPYSASLFSTIENAAKPGVRRVADWMVSNDFGWRVVGGNLTRFGLYLASRRAAEERDRIVRNHPGLARSLAHGRVLAGPFAGMDYSGVISYCSASYPKLLGSYEFELHRTWQTLFTRKYDLIVDVGAADGYYAVGLARMFPDLPVLAYEANPKARQSLSRLARLNGVESRVEIRGHCDPADILSLPQTSTLMIMDCEGSEDVLIAPQTIRSLSRTTLMVETHDGYLPGVTKRLMDRLSPSHYVETIEVVNDHDRPDWIELPEVLQDLTRREVNCLLAETRMHACLRWLVAVPKKD